MFLLDTNVVSELRKAKGGKANKHVTAWAGSVPAATQFISAITILELEIGTLQIARRDAAQGAILRVWLDQHVLPAFAGRILAVDTVVAQRCAKLHVPDPRSDRDALIAATALVHGMTVVTRNTSDFAPTVSLRCPPFTPISSPPGSAARPRSKTACRHLPFGQAGPRTTPGGSRRSRGGRACRRAPPRIAQGPRSPRS
jgi:toxin FitB